MEDELLAERICALVAILEGDEGVDGLAGQLVGNTNDGGLGNRVVLNQGSLDFGSGQTVTTDVNDVIDTSTDPVESLVVTSGTVTSELLCLHVRYMFTLRKSAKKGGSYVVSLVDVQVGVQVSLVATVDGTSNAGP